MGREELKCWEGPLLGKDYAYTLCWGFLQSLNVLVRNAHRTQSNRGPRLSAWCVLCPWGKKSPFPAARAFDFFLLFPEPQRAMTTKTGFIDQEAYRDLKQTLSRMQEKREQESRSTTLPELRMTTLELRKVKERAGSVRGGCLINSKIQFNALTSDSSIFFFFYFNYLF